MAKARTRIRVGRPTASHLVFAKTRGNSSQIYTMLADGTQLQPLTTTGQNERPVWGK